MAYTRPTRTYRQGYRGQYRYRNRPYVRYHPHQFHVYSIKDTSPSSPDSPTPGPGALEESGKKNNVPIPLANVNWTWVIIIMLILVGLSIVTPFIIAGVIAANAKRL